jgi:PRC-barrel domain
MLEKARTLKNYKLNSLDGEIGKVKEFYFDDLHWTIRYLVADTGNWLANRQVLISPYSLGYISNEEKYIAINLTKKQIEDSPSLDSDKPISRQFEETYSIFYGFPRYWHGSYRWGSDPNIVRNFENWVKSDQGGTWDAHLRSTNVVDGYHIQATDGAIGHLEDFIVDDDNWVIRYLIVDTQNFWPGRKVLISPKWIERVSWHESKVFVNLTCEEIRKSPDYREESLLTQVVLTRDYELRLHQYYNRQGYWVDERDAKKQFR